MSSSKRRGQRAVGSGLSHLGGLQYLGEPLLAMGSSIGATATSGLMGLAFDGDRDLMEDVRQRMTYQPRSFSGQQGLQDLGQTVERVAGPALEYMQSNADAKFDETGSAAQATMHVIAPEAIFTMMGLPAALRAAKSVSKMGAAYEFDTSAGQFNTGLALRRKDGTDNPVDGAPSVKTTQQDRAFMDMAEEDFNTEIAARTAAGESPKVAQNKAAQSLFERTKLYRGLDGEWRKWYSDKGIYGKGDLVRDPVSLYGKSVKLGDIMEHPAVFKALPEAKDVNVQFYFDDTKGATKASFNVDVGANGNWKNDPIIKINTHYYDLSNPKDLINPIFHELSHWDDTRLNLSTGGTPEVMKALGKRETALVDKLEIQKTAYLLAEKKSAAAEVAKDQGQIEAQSFNAYMYRDRVATTEAQLKMIRSIKSKNTLRSTKPGPDGEWGVEKVTDYYYPYRHQIPGEVRAHDMADRAVAAQKPGTVADQIDTQLPKSSMDSLTELNRTDPLLPIELYDLRNSRYTNMMDQWSIKGRANGN